MKTESTLVFGVTNWGFFCEDKKNMHDIADGRRQAGRRKTQEKKPAGPGTAVTNPPCILKMYVSWHKQTFPLRISAEERRTTWHMLSTSTVSDYRFLKLTFCSCKTHECEKRYKLTQRKNHVDANPKSFAFCNILCKRANEVSSDSTMCSVKRLLY